MVVVTFEPVAFVKLKPAMVPEVESKLVKFPDTMFNVVPFKVATVPEVNDMVEPVAEPTVKVETSPLVARKFVAKRLVEVVLVPVALVQIKFASERAPVKLKFAIVALVATKLVVVAFVKTPVEGEVFPICVPLIDPPLMVAFEVVRFAMVLFWAFKVVPEAVAKPNHAVEVPFTVKRLVLFTFAMVPEVNDKVVPVTEPPVKAFTVKFVILPLVAARLVVVTLVPVPFTKVKPCNEVPPKTVKVEVTVEEAPTKPPKS